MAHIDTLRNRMHWFVDALGPRGSDARRRGQLFVISCFALAITAIPFCALDYVSEGRVSGSVIAFLIGIPVMAANPFLLRVFRALAVLAVLAAMELLAALTVMTYAHGGVDSAATLWFAAIPFLTGLWAGHRVAIGVAFLALGALTALFVYQWNGYAFPRPLGDDAMLMWKFGGTAGSIAFMAAMVSLYELNTSSELRHRADQVAFRQRLLKGIVESSLDAVISFTGDGKIRSWDGSAERIFGWKPEQAVGKNIFRLLSATKKRSATQDGILRRLQETENQRIFSERTQFEAVDKKGNRLHVEISISPAIQIDRTILYTAFVRDLTKLHRGRERVKRLRHDLTQIIEQTPDGMILLRDSEVVFANEAWRAWFGDDAPLPDAELGVASLASGDDKHRLADSLARATSANERTPLGEFRFEAVTSRPITLDIHFVPNVRFDGVESTLLVARDVTEQSAMRERLSISDRMATMGTLLAGVAHEINNPLTYVIGNLGVIEIALAEGTPEALQRALDAVSDADEGATRIVEIIRDMQRLCTVDDGEAAAIDPRVAIRSALKIAQNRTKYVAKVVVELDDAIPMVLGSVSRVGQVVLNLVVNAAQAFDGEDPRSNTITVRARSESGRVCIEVEDNAGGIAGEQLDRIFDPFYTTKAAGEGTGLGLWICQKIVDGLGGQLTVESQLGRGSRFRIWLDALTEQSDDRSWASGSRNFVIDNGMARPAPLFRVAPTQAMTDLQFEEYEPTPTPPPS